MHGTSYSLLFLLLDPLFWVIAVSVIVIIIVLIIKQKKKKKKD